MWNLFVVLFQSLMLQIAANLLEQEAAEIIVTKEAYLAENCAALDLSRDQAALMVRTSTSLFHDGLFISQQLHLFAFLILDRTSAKSCIRPLIRLTRRDTTPRSKWKRQTKRWRIVCICPPFSRLCAAVYVGLCLSALFSL